MDSSDYVLVQGLRHTRETLEAWNDEPGQILGRWALGAFGVAVAMLGAVWVGAHLQPVDPTPLAIPGVNRPSSWGDVGVILFRNSLVLALHAMACVAGFIAGSSLPLQAEKHSGAWRWIHERAGPLAIAFVAAATLFSLSTQVYALSGSAATLSHQLGISDGLLILTLLPHALLELTALFLPLAAWLIASRREEWHQLLAATFVTTAFAAPVLVVAGILEVYVWPHLLLAVAR